MSQHLVDVEKCCQGTRELCCAFDDNTVKSAHHQFKLTLKSTTNIESHNLISHWIWRLLNAGTEEIRSRDLVSPMEMG